MKTYTAKMIREMAALLDTAHGQHNRLQGQFEKVAAGWAEAGRQLEALIESAHRWEHDGRRTVVDGAILERLRKAACIEPGRNVEAAWNPERSKAMPGKYETYAHHGIIVSVRSDLKGKHREYCLCYKCQNFRLDDQERNCVVANALYRFGILAGITTPVWECDSFVEATNADQD